MSNSSIKTTNNKSPIRLALVSLNGEGLWGEPMHYFNPLAVTTLAGFIIRNLPQGSIEIEIYDSNIAKYDKIVGGMSKFSPDIIGVSAKTDSLLELRRIMKKIQQNSAFKQSKIVIGGILPTIIYKKVLEEFSDAFVIRGEGEFPLLKYIEYISGNEELCRVPGLVFNDNKGQIIENKVASLDLQNYKAQPTDHFIEECGRTGGDFWMESSRGCKGACTFCSKASAHVGNPGHRRFPIERTLTRMEEVNRRFGVSRFRFSDEDFFNDDFDFVRRFLEGIKGLGFPCRMEIDARVGGIFKSEESPEQRAQRWKIWEDMKAGGLYQVFLGVESLSDSQLRRYNKGNTTQETSEAVKILARLKMPYAAGFIPFDPFVTPAELFENFTSLKETGIIFNVNTPIKLLRLQKGTVMANQAKAMDLITGETENGMEYEYRFKDEAVASISNIINVTAELFKRYSLKLNYVLRPAGEFLKGLDDGTRSYLHEKNRSMKMEQLDFLIDICKESKDEMRMREIEKRFRESMIAAYDEIRRYVSQMAESVERRRLLDISNEFVEEMSSQRFSQPQQ